MIPPRNLTVDFGDIFGNKSVIIQTSTIDTVMEEKFQTVLSECTAKILYAGLAPIAEYAKEHGHLFADCAVEEIVKLFKECLPMPAPSNGASIVAALSGAAMPGGGGGGGGGGSSSASSAKKRTASGKKMYKEAQKWISLEDYKEQYEAGAAICAYLPGRGEHKNTVCAAELTSELTEEDPNPLNWRCMACLSKGGEITKQMGGATSGTKPAAKPGFNVPSKSKAPPSSSPGSIPVMPGLTGKKLTAVPAKASSAMPARVSPAGPAKPPVVGKPTLPPKVGAAPAAQPKVASLPKQVGEKKTVAAPAPAPVKEAPPAEIEFGVFTMDGVDGYVFPDNDTYKSLVLKEIVKEGKGGDDDQEMMCIGKVTAFVPDKEAEVDVPEDWKSTLAVPSKEEMAFMKGLGILYNYKEESAPSAIP